MTQQLSSHNFPSEIRDAFFNPGNTCSCFAVSESADVNGKYPCCFDASVSLLGSATIDPDVFVNFCSVCASLGVK